MTKGENFWNHLISTLWFVPSLLVFGGVLLAFIFIGIDSAIGEKFGYFPRLFGIQPSGARDLLAVVAASTITIAVTAFSITIVALTVASTQFSPRILRNFMRDTGNQIVLGILVGIFSYCIIVLRTIREDIAGGGFVPSASVFFAIILGFVSVGCLIYFIHHVATSIQATSIVAHIARETIAEIKNNFPDGEPSPEIDADFLRLPAEGEFFYINAERTGYLQNADAQELINLAEKNDLVLRMQRRIGQFAVEGLPILQIFPLRENFVLSDSLIEKFNKSYEIDDHRTVEGDVAFGLRQIVDIALKALSPAVNDTTTSIICIDYLTAVMACIARRPPCPSGLYGEKKLRLIIEQQSFEDFFELSFNQIRQNADGNVAVILRQLNSVNVLSKINLDLPFEAERRERHNLMQTQARLLLEMAKRTIEADTDLQVISRYYNIVEQSLSKRKIIIQQNSDQK